MRKPDRLREEIERLAREKDKIRNELFTLDIQYEMLNNEK